MGVILIVDDDEVERKNLTRLLEKGGHQVRSEAAALEALARLSKGQVDVVISDLVMDEMDGLQFLELTRELHPEVEFILVTGYASIPSAIQAIKNGAYHYLEKPFRPDEVLNLVGQAVEKKRLRERVKKLEDEVKGGGASPSLVGQSREMQEVVKLIRQVARAECNVLLTGESGTGKELAASMIHHESRRRGSKFLAINCGGFAEDLLANELFGHEKDAFTGATSARAGIMESASGGTLLLDEVGDMPPSMQVKLLRVIEEQEVIRVGGNTPLPIDVRIVAATNQDLKKAVNAGLFRHDLYYRLNVISIRIPPLRERRDDIALLAHFFLNRARDRAAKPIKGFSDPALKALTGYQYPGNVRELENIVERAVAMAQDEMIQVRDLPPDLTEIALFSFVPADESIRPLQDVEEDYIQWVLQKTGRNKSRTAKLLGIDRASLWRHLKKRAIKD
ncbi:MAG TPA: sigma-54 dependent transcriptional regulator [bacterium]|nr:sigma-54 dependent transcriptional regulator [bacterium]